MKLRRLVVAVGLAVMLVPAYASVALAGPEWCDDGSPPPNDFRFRPTGRRARECPTSWLRSTTSGTLELAAGVNTLSGGVAHGMATAIEHAGVKEPGSKPDRSQDREKRDEPEKPEHDKDR